MIDYILVFPRERVKVQVVSSLEVAIVDGTIQSLVVDGNFQECEHFVEFLFCVGHQSLVLNHVGGAVGVA